MGMLRAPPVRALRRLCLRTTPLDPIPSLPTSWAADGACLHLRLGEEGAGGYPKGGGRRIVAEGVIARGFIAYSRHVPANWGPGVT